MGNRIVEEIASIIASIVGLAIVAVLVSQKSSTANVITSAGKSLADVLGAAVKPVS
jgi:hypothetical protein